MQVYRFSFVCMSGYHRTLYSYICNMIPYTLCFLRYNSDYSLVGGLVRIGLGQSYSELTYYVVGHANSSGAV